MQRDKLGHTPGIKKLNYLRFPNYCMSNLGGNYLNLQNDDKYRKQVKRYQNLITSFESQTH